MKDHLLNCLSELSNALETSIANTWERYEFYCDTLDEPRVVCAHCGRTSSFTTDIHQTRHQEWCKIAKALKWINESKKYL